MGGGGFTETPIANVVKSERVTICVFGQSEYDPAKEGLQAPPSHRGSLAPTHRDSVASAAAPAAASCMFNETLTTVFFKKY
jgi:hypothetical protein